MSGLASITFALLIPYDVDLTVDSGCHGSDMLSVSDDDALKLEVTELADNFIQVATGENTFYVDAGKRLWKITGYEESGQTIFTALESFEELSIDAGDYFSAYPTAEVTTCWQQNPNGLDEHQKAVANRVISAIQTTFPKAFAKHDNSNFSLSAWFDDNGEDVLDAIAGE